MALKRTKKANSWKWCEWSEWCIIVKLTLNKEKKNVLQVNFSAIVNLIVICSSGITFFDSETIVANYIEFKRSKSYNNDTSDYIDVFRWNP